MELWKYDSNHLQFYQISLLNNPQGIDMQLNK